MLRAPTPTGQTYLLALLHVGMKQVAHLLVKFRGVNEEVALKIMLEAAEIEVCRAYAAKVVVDKHHLAVEHPCVIKIDFDTCGQTLRYVAVGG